MTDEEIGQLTERFADAIVDMLNGDPDTRSAAIDAAYNVAQQCWDDLLAEVERRKAREAALVEIAQAVATDDTLAYESDAGDDQRCVFCYGAKNEHGVSEYQYVQHFREWKHADDCPVTKARALLKIRERQP